MAEESTTSKIAQTNSNLEDPFSKAQPFRIPMNPKLLKAARSGDKRILDELLQQDDFFSGASVREITITVSEVAATQEDNNCLLGVTLEGNTVLHIVASRGYLDLAREICRKARSLLAAPNTRLDTPLHCAARVGDDKMVSLMIQFAREGGIETRVLRAKNWDEANALHEATKYDHVNVAKVLMEEDAELASTPNCAGMSPLYLAIVTGSLNVAKALLQTFSCKMASSAYYAGPNNETALHQAVRISREISKYILQWKPMVTKHGDVLGRIPLHFAASDGDRDTVKLLLEHDPSTAYISDANGFFPIHIAASVGNISVIDQILKQCPDTDELLDERGRNFLHVAFQHRRLEVVKKIISKEPDLRRLLNDQDKEGNAPLHTAVENMDQKSVYFLLRDKIVHVNVINNNGFTPLDLANARRKIGWPDLMTVESIVCCLALAKSLVRSQHAFERDESGDGEVKHSSPQRKEEELKETQRSISQNLTIVIVLIATVTFAAGFTVPGGYIADDHPSHGTAVLAKKYAFNVFLVSDAIAFFFSIFASYQLVIAGMLTVDADSHQRAIIFSMWCLEGAYLGMFVAFWMGIYVTSGYSSSTVLCIVGFGIISLTGATGNYSLLSLLKTVGIREGYRHCIWPTTVCPHVEKVLRPLHRPSRIIVGSLLAILAAGLSFVLIPLLLTIKN